MYRLFETGQREEERVCRNLRTIGCEVVEFDDQGQQFAVGFFGGHFAGHLDGSLINLPEALKTWHVLEIKTHNTKSFNELKQEGVKKSKPMHYSQMMVYMHGTGMTRALYFAVCKETDEIYTERIHYSKEEAEALLERARRIITTTEPPPRLSDRPDYYECKWCDAHDICHGCEKALPLPVISCKQCCYATPDTDKGGWACGKHGCEIENTEKAELCNDHLCLPGLFPYARVTDFTDGMICFENRDDNKEWQHGGFCHTTKELMELTREAL